MRPQSYKKIGTDSHRRTDRYPLPVITDFRKLQTDLNLFYSILCSSSLFCSLLSSLVFSSLICCYRVCCFFVSSPPVFFCLLTTLFFSALLVLSLLLSSLLSQRQRPTRWGPVELNHLHEACTTQWRPLLPFRLVFVLSCLLDF